MLVKDRMMIDYEEMSVSDRIEFLTWVYKVDKHKYEYATYAEGGMRHFHGDLEKK